MYKIDFLEFLLPNPCSVIPIRPLFNSPHFMFHALCGKRDFAGRYRERRLPRERRQISPLRYECNLHGRRLLRHVFSIVSSGVHNSFDNARKTVSLRRSPSYCSHEIIGSPFAPSKSRKIIESFDRREITNLWNRRQKKGKNTTSDRKENAEKTWEEKKTWDCELSPCGIWISRIFIYLYILDLLLERLSLRFSNKKQM